VYGKATVTIQLIDYINTSHRDYGNDCCDNVGYICFLKCDNWFYVCVTDLPYTHAKDCLYLAKTYVLYNNDDKFNFPSYGQKLAGNVYNPMKFTFDGPLVRY